MITLLKGGRLLDCVGDEPREAAAASILRPPASINQAGCPGPSVALGERRLGRGACGPGLVGCFCLAAGLEK